MPDRYIVLAIPAFLALIGLELAATRRLGRDAYRLADSVNDLSCGILDQLLVALFKAAAVAGYLFVYGRLRLFELSAGSAWVWVGCFLGVDFLYYWFHRLSHVVNALWAAHVVHHQSEEFNLSVALRQGALQAGFSWIFYLPLALLGFPPLVFLTCAAVDTLYQFWIHTRAIGKLGPLEWVLNTPSHHRVHHACNPKYIDRNYAGALIVWDRLFGSFKEEEEEPAYGITKPLQSWNPVWANTHYWVEIAGQARRARRWRDKLRTLVARPGWRPEELGGFQPAPEITRASQRRFETSLPRGLAVYGLVQFSALLAATAVLLFSQDRVPRPALFAAALAVTVCLVVIGALFERKPWALRAEAARLLAVALTGGAWAAMGDAGLPALAVILTALASLAWLARQRTSFPLASPAAAARPASS
jgi:sterol desaturase/sphingolipid hydroxylase (fatty acid hydroxylase superfamily)